MYHVLPLVVGRFILSEPELKELFGADYCVTELGGASIPDFKLRPTLSFFQSTAEKGETEAARHKERKMREAAGFSPCEAW